MSKNSYEEMIRQINEAQMQLKIRLEQVSRLRIDCLKLELEMQKLYKPQCLEILETLEDVSAPADAFDHNGGYDIESRENDQNYGKVNEVFRTNEDVSKKSTT